MGTDVCLSEYFEVFAIPLIYSFKFGAAPFDVLINRVAGFIAATADSYIQQLPIRGVSSYTSQSLSLLTATYIAREERGTDSQVSLRLILFLHIVVIG